MSPKKASAASSCTKACTIVGTRKWSYDGASGLGVAIVPVPRASSDSARATNMLVHEGGMTPPLWALRRELRPPPQHLQSSLWRPGDLQPTKHERQRLGECRLGWRIPSQTRKQLLLTFWIGVPRRYRRPGLMIGVTTLYGPYPMDP